MGLEKGEGEFSMNSLGTCSVTEVYLSVIFVKQDASFCYI